MERLLILPILVAAIITSQLTAQDQNSVHIGDDMQLLIFGDQRGNDRYLGITHSYPKDRMYMLPAWEDFAIDMDQGVAYVTGLNDAADLIADEGLIDRADIDELCNSVTAVCYVESGLMHYDKKDKIITGDNGKAVGIAQLHPLWEKHFGLSRESLRGSLEMCARLLLRGGWKAGDVDAQNLAFSYYNTGKRKMYSVYVNKVRDALETIEEE